MTRSNKDIAFYNYVNNNVQNLINYILIINITEVRYCPDVLLSGPSSSPILKLNVQLAATNRLYISLLIDCKLGISNLANK